MKGYGRRGVMVRLESGQNTRSQRWTTEIGTSRGEESREKNVEIDKISRTTRLSCVPTTSMSKGNRWNWNSCALSHRPGSQVLPPGSLRSAPVSLACAPACLSPRVPGVRGVTERCTCSIPPYGAEARQRSRDKRCRRKRKLSKAVHVA